MLKTARLQLWRYGIAVLCVVVVLVLALVLDPLIDAKKAPYLLFFSAVMVSAWCGGTASGLLSTALSAIVSDYFFIEPQYSLAISDGSSTFRTGLFVLQGILFSVLCDKLRTTRQQAEARLKLLQVSESDRQQTETLLQQAHTETENLLSLVDALLAAAPVAVCFLDNDLRYVRINQAMASINGVPIEQHLGRYLREVLPDEAAVYEAQLRQVLKTGEPLLNIEISREVPGNTDSWKYWLGNYYPVRDANGHTIGVGMILADITQTKQVETALKRSNERFQIATAAVRGVLYEWNAVTGYLERSSGLLELIGYTPEEAEPTLEWWSQQVHPDDLPELNRIAQDALLTGKTGFTAEYRLRHRDGHYRYVWDRSQIERNAAGQAIRSIGWSIDVTDRVRAEQERTELLEREQQARAAAESAQRQLMMIFETSPIGIGFLNAAQQFISINEALAEINGLSREQHLGRSISQLFGQTDPTVVSLFQRIYATGTPFISPNLAICAPGRHDRRPGYYNVYYLPTVDATGRVESVLMYVVDVTDRFRLTEIQRFLAESSKVLSSSLDYQTTLTSIAKLVVPRLADWCTVHIRDESGKTRQLAVTHINPEKVAWAEELQQRYPYDPDQASGVPRVIRTGEPELYPEIPDSLLVESARDAEHLQILRELGFSSAVIVPLKAHDHDRTLGAISFVAAESGRRFDEVDVALAEELARRAALAMENAHLYELAQRDRAKAEAANRIKDEFLAVLSHELRSPLNPILGWTKLLRTRQFDPQTTDRALDTIERNAKLQTQLIEDLLDVSRILQGKMVLNVCPVDLASTIEAALETVRLAAEAKSIQIETIFDPTVSKVFGDANRLQQIVWNLLSNAIKFTPSGGRVEVRLNQGTTLHQPPNELDGSSPSSDPALAEYAQISVSDTGKGISSQFLPYVFDYFRQEDGTTTRQFGGLGLGLAIVRHLTELHGGTVQVESAGEGKGATFTIRLPLLRVESNRSKVAPASPEAVSPATPLRGVRVLVVDDEADMRDLVVVILEEYGAELQVAASAEDALKLMDSFKPDVLVSDIGMPQMDGYMLMRQIRQRLSMRGETVVAIALTAYAGEANYQQAIAAGFQHHLAKPIDPDELITAIIRLLQEKSSDPPRKV